MDEEPVLIYLGGAAVVVSAALIAANALSWTHLDPDQVAAVVAFVATFAGLLAAGIRGQVYSPARHAREVAEALATPAPLPKRPPTAGQIMFGDEDEVVD